MLRWASLPAEILTRVFQTIQSTKQLGECRLVHRTWDSSAESAMFSREISVRDCLAFQRLYYHLRRKPAKGRLIRYLNLDFDNVHMDRSSLKHAFKLFFTPNLEVLKGEMLSQHGGIGYEIIREIVYESTQEFNKLRYLSNTQFTTELYWETVSLFKQSLQRLDLQFTDCDDMMGKDNKYLINHVVLEIGEFKQLKHLNLQMFYDDSIVEMDKVLNQCEYLQHLRAAISMNQPESLEDYFQINEIKKIDKLRSLLLYTDPGESPILLEYCTTKYPNIERIVYESPDGPPGFAEDMESFSRELEILNAVPYYEIEFMLHPDDSIEDIRNTLKTDKNDVVIDVLDDNPFPESRGKEVGVKVTSTSSTSEPCHLEISVASKAMKNGDNGLADPASGIAYSA
ncbi:hypothetical protein G6F42_021428 [Rhizopus arrhizus]|nr:hypothetical protein G6F42_021428 [Rhizopus arrhizus]